MAKTGQDEAKMGPRWGQDVPKISKEAISVMEEARVLKNDVSLQWEHHNCSGGGVPAEEGAKMKQMRLRVAKRKPRRSQKGLRLGQDRPR